MKKTDFNKGWFCRCLTRDGAAYPVTLPHDAMRSEKRSADSVGGNNIGWYEGGDYEYTKSFFVPDEQRGKVTVFEFEGVYRNAEVYINGRRAAYRPYGYTNFYVDATGFLNYDAENEIRVTAKNSDQPNSRWYSGTGIYRPVWTYTGGTCHIPVNGVRISTVNYKEGEIEVCVKTSGDGEVFLKIIDADGMSVVSATASSAGGLAVFKISVPNVHLWSCDTPYLYSCRVSFGEDTAEESFGVRSLYWGPKNGLTLNGERVIIRGACIHHDNGLLGACTYPKAERRRIKILKENGYNAVRSSHYPASKALLDACDREGMLMMDEYVDVWYIHKTKYDYAAQLADWWRQDLRDMVDKDFNHPSVIMYSTGNEVAETAQEKGIELTGQMTRFLHEADGTRPVTCGINIFFNFLSSVGLGVYSDEKAEKTAADTQTDKKPKKKSVGSEFYNTLACKVGDWFMKFGATLPPCDLKTRDAFANMDIAGYNYGIFRYRHDLKKYSDRLILGSETFCKDAYAFWELAKEHPRIIGDFVWAGMDYIGETGEGCAEYSDYKFDEEYTRMTGGNGRIDLLGKPRAEAAFTRVAFERDAGPFIAVTPVYQTEKIQLTGWQLTKALESWSWRGCAGMNAAIEVYARADLVELFINGTSVGRQKMKRGCRAVFKTAYEDGEITAVSYDKTGREVGRCTLVTAEREAFLHIEPEESAVRPDEFAFVWLRYADKNGVLNPMEKHTLHVSVKNGVLDGLGSANAYVEGNYSDDVTKTYYGEAMAIVRADGGGDVEVIVEDEHGVCSSALIPLEKQGKE